MYPNLTYDPVHPNLTILFALPLVDMPSSVAAFSQFNGAYLQYTGNCPHLYRMCIETKEGMEEILLCVVHFRLGGWKWAREGRRSRVIDRKFLPIS